jgi:hypothetical protein
MESIKKIEKGRLADTDASSTIVDDSSLVTVKGADLQTYIQNLDARLVAIGSGGGENPTYTEPTVTINTVSASFEKGETFDTAVDFDFIQNDAGAVAAYYISKDGVSTLASATNLFTFTDVIVPITLQGTVSYLDGPIKNDIAGDPYPTGRILAGSISTDIKTLTPRLKIFYGSSVSVPTNNAEVRALSTPTIVWNNETTVTLSTGTVNLNFVVAVPTSLTTAVTLSGVDITNSFALTYYYDSSVTLTLPDSTTQEYRIYVLTIGNAYPESATHIITL